MRNSVLLFMLCLEPRFGLSNSFSIIDMYVASDTTAGHYAVKC